MDMMRELVLFHSLHCDERRHTKRGAPAVDQLRFYRNLLALPCLGEAPRSGVLAHIIEKKKERNPLFYIGSNEGKHISEVYKRIEGYTGFF